ncbi:MAG TPA: hypothetical protein VFS43_01805 [Polyangiaceae bacterium]|nr:hypothetical protein [Polyangiaceae bacterium]
MNHSAFALQIALRYRDGEGQRDRLRRAVGSGAPAMSYRQKGEYFRRLAEALLPGNASFDYGIWDYFDDDARAQKEYATWAEGLGGKEARTSPAPAPPPGGYRDAAEARRYLVFTAALLMRHGSASDRAVFAAQRDLSGPALWTRQTFVRLVATLGAMSSTGVVADTVYLIPGDDPSYALTPDDLKHPQFHYLREISG